MTLRHEPTEVRQLQIIRAARQIITTRGMEHLTIEAIAEEVGLTEGAIYRHFESKQEILLALLQEIEDLLFERLQEAQEGITSPLEKLEGILKTHLSHVEQRGGVSFIVIAEALRFGDPEVRARVAKLLDRYAASIKGILQQGVEAGEIRGDMDLDTAAQLFFGVIQGAVTFWSLHERSTPLARRHRSLWEIYQNGIAQKP